MQKPSIAGFRLSPQQRHLWLAGQTGSAYRTQCALLIEGLLNPESLRETIHRVVSRHESLQTTFKRTATLRMPLQSFDCVADTSWRFLEAGEVKPGREVELIDQVFQEERNFQFDFEHGPLTRATLVSFSKSKHALVLTWPALCADAASAKYFVSELSQAFAAPDRTIGEAPLQYVQFSEWQNEMLAAEEAEEGKEFWRRQEFSTRPPLKLPLEKLAQGDVEFSPRSFAVDLSREVVTGIEAVAGRSGTSSSAVLYACWQALLCRITGRREVVTGYVFDSRKYEEFEGLIGLASKWVLVKSDFEPGRSFAETVKQVEEALQDAWEWQEFFSADDAEEIETADARRSQAVLFEYEERQAEYRANGLAFKVQRQYCLIDNFKLKLSCIRTGDSLTAEFQYDASRLEETNVERTAGYFVRLLTEVVRTPEAIIDRVDLLSEAERHYLADELNRTETVYPRNKCLHELFEGQARLTPSRPAVVFNEAQLTYAELNARANQLAHVLRKRGVAAGAPVGLCVERSLEMMVALIGILKAGGAYLPLDPEQPAARLAYQVKAAGSSILITQQSLLQQFCDVEVQALLIDSDDALFEEQLRKNPELATSPDSPVYTIFTSGSTGAPKAVSISHRNLVNYSHFICRKLGLNPDTSEPGLHFGTVSTLSADLGNTSIFPALLSGGCLHIISHELAMDGGAFAEYSTRHELDVLKIVPSHFSALLAEGGVGVLPQRFLILGGEALSLDLATRIREAATSPAKRSRESLCRVINHYGPTETTIGALTFELPPVFASSWGSTVVPIGRPIANTQSYILDDVMKLSPLGVPGELYIGGAGVGIGYLNRPAQTAERFVPHPFSTSPGARLYRTGDVARSLPDGNIEFLGRVDRQVKIRGYRIELGEIENTLLKHGAVREAVVLKNEDRAGASRLVAYVVTRQPLGKDELQAFLSKTLPFYMLPASIVFLKSLPITRNGKVDRSALPSPESAQQRAGNNGYVEPRTQVERTLAKIWAEVLGLDKVGIHDNFFELGGDSILSIQIISRANRAGAQLAGKHIFQYQTIAELAPMARLSQSRTVDQPEMVGPVPLTPIQQRFFETQPIDPHHYNQTVLLKVRSTLDAALLEQAVRQLLLHHDALRLRFYCDFASWRQITSTPAESTPFLRVDLSKMPPEDREAAIESVAAEQQASFNLSEGPLLRVVLMDLGAGQPGRLLIVVHHLAVDGVSWRILLEDLHTAYEQLSAGKVVQLPHRTSSFQLWAQRLSTYANSETAKGELSYWTAEKRREAGRLPLDFPEGVNSAGSARNVTVSLTAEVTRALLRDVPALYRTQINDVLLTALVQAYANQTGQRSLLVGLEGHGREPLFEDLDLSRTVGWFTSYFPLHLHLEKADEPGESLKSIKEQLREVPNRGIGWGLLRYLNNDEKIIASLQSFPSPELSFNYLGQLDRILPERSPFSAAPESAGSNRSPRALRAHIIDVNAHIVGGQLWLRWIYSENLQRRETVEALAQGYVEALRLLVEHCCSREAGSYVPADFPLAKLSASKLDKLFAKSGDVEDLYPISAMQRAMLFESLRDPDSGAYFVQISCDVQSYIDADSFARAWQHVLDRHSSLRTSFVWEQLDEPLQIVHRDLKMAFQYEDWRGLAAGQQQEKMLELLRRDKALGFKLSQPPLLRVLLVQLGDDFFHVVWSNHHLILDGWCRTLIVNEVLTCYDAFSRGQSPSLEPARQFRDYIAWLKEQDLSRAEAFWREELKGFTSPVTLSEYGSSGVSGDYLESTGDVSVETTMALGALARRHQLTLHSLVQGAWALLLGRYTGSNDVLFGVTVSGRPADLAGSEQIIGLFINTLPVRVRLPRDASLLSWLKDLQAHQAEMREYEYAPLGQIRSWSEVPRRLQLFESIFVFNNHPSASSFKEQGRSLELNSFHSVNWSNVYANYPLILVISPGTQLTIRMIYDSRRFSTVSIAQQLADFREILEEITANAERMLIDFLPVRCDGVPAGHFTDEADHDDFNFEL
jgi:amino acid adenylation domain-containing protein/non-ribosomal peptide synthase protein (TIGR01720 family)